MKSNIAYRKIAFRQLRCAITEWYMCHDGLLTTFFLGVAQIFDLMLCAQSK
jgi:hypothetical protein